MSEERPNLANLSTDDRSKRDDRAELFQRFQRAALLVLLGLFGLFLIALVVTGETWLAISYAFVALFAALVLLAVYFWSTMLLGGVLEAARRRPSAVPWEIDGGLEAPEHDIDPGLELMAAGVLVYRVGEVRPTIHFRQVPLVNVRAVRPFVVARTGAERAHQFRFTLDNEQNATRFTEMVTHHLQDAPQLVMPHTLLVPDRPRRLVGQRWRLHVHSGATVVTSLGFMFVNGTEQSTSPSRGRQDLFPDEAALDWHQELLPQLLDAAIKHDAMRQTQEIILEDA